MMTAATEQCVEPADHRLDSPSESKLQRFAWPIAATLLLITAALLGVTLATILIAHRPTPLGDAMWLAHPGIFAIVGAIIIRKLPLHPIGWMFVGVGVFGSLSDAGSTYAYLGTMQDIPLSAVAAWAGLWAWLPPMGLLAMAFSRFPDGRPAGRWSGLVGTATFWLSMLMTVMYAAGFWAYRSPALAVDGADERISTPLVDVANVLVPVFLLGAIVVMGSLFLRFHRSHGVERQQLKWLALVILVAIPSIVAGMILPSNGLVATLSDVLGTPMWLAVGVGLAVLRYRLYDIDRIISRTLSYIVLTIILVGLYAAGVLGLGAIARKATGERGAIVVAVSTLLVAAVFQPLRHRVQRVIDRRFNRAGYDAVRTLETFSRHLRGEVDSRRIAQQLRAAVATSVQPAAINVVVLDRD